MPVSQAGSLNLTALVVPDVYVQIETPQVALINGLPTDIVGVVGGATWGPKNAPAVVSSMADYAAKFGPLQNKQFDAGTTVAVAVQQGAQNFRVVRVTDGSDVAASASLGAGALILAAKYTGSLGNKLLVKQVTGSKAGTLKLTVSMPGMLPEVFDNIDAGDGLVSVALANAINQGAGALRGPSQLVVASASGTEPSGFSVGTVSLTGGTDGWPTAAAQLVGADLGQRTGMYALRGSRASIGVLSDVTDMTTFSVQAEFGLSEGIYMICASAAGDTIEAAVTAKASAGIDSYAVNIMFGDWIYWNDPVNQVTRLVSPQGFKAGRLANLSPQQSSLNKPLYAIAGTQRSMQESHYSTAELAVLAQNGFDVITNPVPGGNYFGCRIGHNTSSNPLTYGDNYTRLTNYTAFTLNSAMGPFIGELHNETERQKAKGAITSFLSNMEGQGMIGNVNGGPAFSVQLDAKNNPLSRVALGYMQCDVRITYFSIIEKLLINVEGSQATQATVARVSTQSTTA